MKKKISDQRNLTRRLGRLFLLFALLLVPIGAWAEEYALWIGDVQVTSDNSSNIQGGNIKLGYAKFYSNADANILELHGILTKGCIKSGLGNLSIKLYGHNQLGSDGNDAEPAIYSTNGGKLTLTKASSYADASLYLESYGVSIINGFESFVYTAFSVDPSSDNYSYSAEDGFYDGDTPVESATFYTGSSYPLWVGGTPVTSANSYDIKDDNILAGTVSFDPEVNLLTLNNVNIDMASDDPYVIKSSIANLRVKLVGENEVTLDASMFGTTGPNPIAFANFTGESSPTLTFKSEWDKNNTSFGSLTINGADTETIIAQGYTVSNTWVTDDNVTNGWKKTINSDNVKVWYLGETYDLTIGGVTVTDDNAENVLEGSGLGTISFDIGSSTLTFNNFTCYGLFDEYNEPFIINGLGDLTIHLLGFSDFSSGSIFIGKSEEGGEDYTVTFTTDEANRGSLVFKTYETDFCSGHTVVFNNALGWSISDEDGDSHSYDMTIDQMNYDLTVGGVAVTSANASNITGDHITSGTVSYYPITNTLRLDNATLTERIYYGDEGTLTIELSGANNISPSDGGAIVDDYEWGDCSLVIKKAADAESCSLTLNSSSNDFSVISGFTDVTWEGLNVYPATSIEYNTSDKYLVDGEENATNVFFTTGTLTTYDLTVGGVTVTNANALNVLFLNENGNPSVVFDASTNTLTLNKLAAGTAGAPYIVNGLENLTINLVGYSQIDECSCFIAKSGDGDENNNVTFTTSTSDPGELCVWYDDPNNPYNPENAFTPSPWYTGHSLGWENGLGWKEQYDSDYGCGFYITTDCSLSVGGVIMCDKEGHAINDGPWGESVSFDGTYLYLENAEINGDIIYNGDFDEFYIKIIGANTVNRITYIGQQEVDLYVMKANESTGSFSLTVAGNGTDAAISGFISECITENDFYDSDRGLYWKPTVTNDVITSLFITSVFGGGDGTEGNPYVISTPLELKLFALRYNQRVAEDVKLDCYVELGAVIDCTGLTDFEPIGDNSPFRGTFDGKSANNFYIENLNYSLYSTGTYNGLFSEIDGGTVKNLKLVDCTFLEGDDVGAIVGCLTSGTIDNCEVATCTLPNGTTNVGGVAGVVKNGTISNCTVFATSVNSNSYSGNNNAGGIVGLIDCTETEEGTVTVSSNTVANGEGSTPTTILGSHANSSYSYAGGIVGQCLGDGDDVITISGNNVKDDTEINSIGGASDSLFSGAIVGNAGDATLSDNVYYYTVTTSTKNGEENAVVKDGYTHRGIGNAAVDNGVEMYTQAVTLPEETVQATVMGVEGTYYGLDAEGTGILVAPGQTATIKAIPGDGYAIASLTATTTEATIETESEALEDGVVQYTFEMPDAPVTVAVTTVVAYNLWIAGTRVSTANATNVLNELNGKEEPTVVYDAENHKLTLDGATINGGIRWSEESALTIKVIGANSIDNSDSDNGGNCIYNNSDTRRLLTFERGDANNACSLSMVCRTGGFNPVFNFTKSSPAVTDLFWAMSDENHALVASTLLGGGAGTSGSPFMITSAEELSTFAAYVNTATTLNDGSNGAILDKYVKLSTSFNWPSNSTLPQIQHFGGTFDGNEKTITGLKVNDNSLFKTTGGKDITVKDLTLDGLYLSFESAGQSDPIGGIVDYLFENQTIDNCVVKNTTIECGTAYANPCIGGISGYCVGGTITNCSVEDITINAQSTDSDSSGAYCHAGGILGNLYEGTVSNCHVMGTSVIQSSHTFSSEVYAGAIIGHNSPTGVTLANNYYDYSVSTKTKAIEDEDYTEKSGYEPRALGYNLVQIPQTEDYEQLPDVITNNGAVMYTKLVTFNVSENCGLYSNDGYEPLTDSENKIYSYAPEQTITFSLFPDNYYSIETVTLTYTAEGATEATVETLENIATDEDMEDYIYSFTMHDAEATLNVTLLVPRDLDITFSESQTWATYYATENLTVPEGLTAYVVSSVDASDGTVTAESVDYIPADQAVLLKRGDEAALSGFIATPYTGTEATFTNLLLGSDEEVSISSITTGDVYVLYKDGFTRATTGTIPANRGYLLLSDAIVPAGSRLAIIEGMSSDISEKVKVDSEKSASVVYDLQGRKVHEAQPDSQFPIHNSKLKKGLYIVNGKKTIIK